MIFLPILYLANNEHVTRLYSAFSFSTNNKKVGNFFATYRRRTYMSSEPPKSCIENLPNELWVRIFTHIDWMNLLLAFYGLNKRINQLFLSTDVLSIYSSCLINRHDSIYLYFKVIFIFQNKILLFFFILLRNFL